MKLHFKNSISLIIFLLLVLLCIASPQNASAYYFYLGPATYTNGSHSETFSLSCGDFKQLQPGGTLTFVAGVTGGDIMDWFDICTEPLPPGATFPCITVNRFGESIFTWTPTGAFSGNIVFTLDGYPECTVSFDWPMPVELSSFASFISVNDVTLNWQTSSEINNSGFEIEKIKMLNGNVQDWIKAGTVPGNGTKTTPSGYTFTDRGLNSGIYQYRLKQIDYNGNYEYYYLSNNVQIGVPVRSELSQNYPNPFNPSTIINFNLSNADHVSLKVYNSSGIEVKTIVEEFKPAGYYSVTFDGKNLASGIYYYKLASGNFTVVKKMVLLK